MTINKVKDKYYKSDEYDDDLPDGVRFDKQYLKYVSRDTKVKKRRDPDDWYD